MGRRRPPCPSGKQRYRSEQEARRSIRSLRGQGRGECNAYRCPDCRNWHLTSQPGRTR